MSYLVVNEDLSTIGYNLFTRGITLGLDSDYLRSLSPILDRDEIVYGDFGFLNDWGCFSPDAGRFFRLFNPKKSFYDKIFKYIVDLTNKDDRVMWVYRRFFNSRNNMNMIYKVINKASPKFGKGLMNTTTIDFPIESVSKDGKSEPVSFILFITFDSSKIIDIKVLGAADPTKDRDIYEDNEDSLGGFPMDTDLANMLNVGDYK